MIALRKNRFKCLKQIGIFCYSFNGNIQTALLNGNATNLPYENFTYNYDAVKKNRLLNIHNSVNSTTSNYEYDEIGNITKDELEGNKDMVWSIYGKLLMAKKINTGVKITYTYDASGNRISKQVGNTREEWTVRDAGGNIMVTYIKDPGVNNGKLTTQGYEMYGSTAIGTWEKHRDVETEGADNNERVITRGEQKIRFSNHLGNTMVVLSDIKRQVQSPENPSQIAGYEPVVLNATDYSAYGESLIGREFNSTGIKYGFNGKLNDNDLGYQDYGMRLSSVKKRGFLSVDPLKESYPWYSPYQFAGNKPIISVDLDGLEEYIVITDHFKNGSIKSITIQYTQTKENTEGRVDVKLRQVHNGVANGDYIAESEKVLRIERDYRGNDIKKSHSNSLTPSEIKIIKENSTDEEEIDKSNDAWFLIYKGKMYESDDKTIRNADLMIDRIAVKNFKLKSYKIINDVPPIIVSNRSNNGDIDLNSKSSFKTAIDAHLKEISTQGNIKRITINLNINIRGAEYRNSGVGNMLPYVLAARSKISSQIKQYINSKLGLDSHNIFVNINVQNGDPSKGNTSITTH